MRSDAATDGDEFVVAVPQSTAPQANRLADDLRHAVHSCALVLAGHPFPPGALSISVGVVCASFDPDSPAEDARGGTSKAARRCFAPRRRLYRAKAMGRNQVCVA